LRLRKTPILTLALLVVLGFTVAGCGATKKESVVNPGGPLSVQQSTAPPIRVSGKSTILMNLKAGTLVACKDWPGVQVTVPATGALVTARSRGTKELRLKRLPDGTIHVSCLSTHR
jgi:hypothetical protein